MGSWEEEGEREDEEAAEVARVMEARGVEGASYFVKHPKMGGGKGTFPVQTVQDFPPVASTAKPVEPLMDLIFGAAGAGSTGDTSPGGGSQGPPGTCAQYSVGCDPGSSDTSFSAARALKIRTPGLGSAAETRCACIYLPSSEDGN